MVGDRSQLFVRGLFYTLNVGLLLPTSNCGIPKQMKFTIDDPDKEGDKIESVADVLNNIEHITKDSTPPMVQLLSSQILLYDQEKDNPSTDKSTAICFAIASINRVVAEYVAKDAKNTIEIKPNELTNKDWKLPKHYKN